MLVTSAAIYLVSKSLISKHLEDPRFFDFNIVQNLLIDFIILTLLIKVYNIFDQFIHEAAKAQLFQ